MPRVSRRSSWLCVCVFFKSSPPLAANQTLLLLEAVLLGNQYRSRTLDANMRAWTIVQIRKAVRCYEALQWHREEALPVQCGKISPHVYIKKKNIYFHASEVESIKVHLLKYNFELISSCAILSQRCSTTAVLYLFYCSNLSCKIT